MKVSIDLKKKEVTIVLPLEEPRASGSGKTMIIASTSGSKTATDATYEGKPVTVGMNVWFKP